ncbi:MAG TPA: hypothetical protein VKZ53_30120 [Candidatus Angelobacter sp.]|nr:hypothetical protein [Candidatus Angelobacter sp.]
MTVVKGIHNDRVGAHITVQCAFETYHIYLTRDYDRDGFVWEPAVVCTGSQALQGDVARTKYSTGGTLYRTSR